jgi:predicted acyltransferase
VIWLLALFYLLFDMLPLKWLAFPLIVAGMNSIALYLMGQLLRPWAIQKVVEVHAGGFLATTLGASALADDMYGRLIFPTAAVVVFWLIALWMYRRKIFVRV